ncbi:substrate-binding domain-containing protein [Parafilimonas sp.]|uniref:substrate-binding domain-containing protein n=1 Tax=Parafilimonas sp. TaxID=1969739 RepID=UPI0039E391D1
MEKNKEKVTAGVKEIARLGKVSIATVDRVIHNRGGVSKKTKAKIQSIIEKLNYQPNVLAQRLALTSRGTIRLAVLLPAISEETEFWQAPLDGAKQALDEIKQYGIHIEQFLFDQNDQKSFSKQVKNLIKFKADGILFTPTFPEESTKLIERAEKTGTPYVLINADIPQTDTLCYIGAEIFSSGYIAAQLVHYCIDEKKKVLVANIAAEIDNNYAILRKEEGFMNYFKDNNLPNEVLSFKTTQTSYSSVSKRLSGLIKKQNDIGAILVTNSRVSVVAKYLESAGLKDIILLGYDFINENITYLKKGFIDFLICEKPQEQGYRGIMALFQYLVFSKPMEKKYFMPIDIITKENYQFYRN